MPSFLQKTLSMYLDGFRSMVLGRVLWSVILVKLFAIYLLSQIFFPDYLQTRFPTEELRAEHVLDNLTAPAQPKTDSGGPGD